jgi:hypothetical protein
MDQDRNEAIEADRKQFPNCNYSESLQKRCSQKNNEMMCETVRSVLRMCNNQKPVEIYRKLDRSSDHSDIDADLIDSLFPKNIGGGLSIFGDFMSPFGVLPDIFVDRQQNTPPQRQRRYRQFDDNALPPHRMKDNNIFDGYKPGSSGSA